MKKLLQITLRSDIGGGPEHVYQLIKGLESLEKIYVASPTDEPYFSRFRKIVDSRFFTLPKREFSIRRFIQLLLYIRKEKIEIVHSHGKGAGVYSRLLKLFNPTLQIIHTFHGWHVGTYNNLQSSIYTLIEFLFSILSRYLICISKTEYESIPRIVRNTFKNKFQIIPNGVEISQENIEFTQRDIEIVVVSRFDFQKNFDLVIEIAKKLPKRKFHVLGEITQEAQTFKDYCSEFGISNMIFQGGVPSCRPFFKKSKIILSTSRWEGLPFSILEACSEGCVPVLSNVTGHIDFQFDNFFYFDLNQTDLLVDKIDSILTNQSFWEQSSLQFQNKVYSNYSINRMIEENLKNYL